MKIKRSVHPSRITIGYNIYNVYDVKDAIGLCCKINTSQTSGVIQRGTTDLICFNLYVL